MASRIILDMSTYSADDLALAALLRIVPGGYRLVGPTDERFVGIRDKFTRLALRHLGPKPSLVGFCSAGQDPLPAAAALAGWAAQNLRPSAIQRHVDPGVVVVCLDPPAGVDPGRVPGLAVHTSIWVVTGGRVSAPSRPPGAPAARLVKEAVAALERGDGPPSIGTIDVAERALMAGRSSRRTFTLGGGAGLGAVILVFLLLRLLPGILARPAPAPTPGQENVCAAAQGCFSLGSASNGTTARVAPGSVVVLRLSAPGGGQDGCLQDSDPAVLELQQCTATGGDTGEVLAVYRALARGSANLSRAGFRVTVEVS